MNTRIRRPLAGAGWSRGALAVALVLMTGAAAAGTGTRTSGFSPVGRVTTAVQRGVVTPRLSCAALALDVTRPQPGLPDFTIVPGAPTRITSATGVPAGAGTAAHCDVTGYVAPQVHFDLKLPVTTWQGRYMQFGCSGFCGALFPTSFPTCDLQPGGDFAVATTDDGHSAFVLDALWAADNPQLRLDFGSRAAHVVSLAAKAIMTAFYGIGPRFSYFNGCSTGGREALMEAQRHPQDFDGILAGAPALLWAPLGGEIDSWNTLVNLDAHGNEILTAGKLPGLHAAVLAACDGADGLPDGQISDPRACTFDPASLRCPTGVDQPSCLTPAQVETVRKLYQGPADGRGRRLYPGGEPLGSEQGWAGQIVPAPGAEPFVESLGDNYLRYMSQPAGQSASLSGWMFTLQDFDRLRAMATVYDSSDPDLSAFRGRGGKLILWHGWSDPAIPPTGTIAYYQAVRDRMGGLAATESFARLFMVPSMYHCFGGYGPTQFDLVDPITRWVEQGTAPDRIVATQVDAGGAAVSTRPLFPYPARAVYRGSGSVDDAASFEQVLPSPLPDDHIAWVGNDLLR